MQERKSLARSLPLVRVAHMDQLPRLVTEGGHFGHLQLRVMRQFAKSRVKWDSKLL